MAGYMYLELNVFNNENAGDNLGDGIQSIGAFDTPHGVHGRDGTSVHIGDFFKDPDSDIEYAYTGMGMAYIELNQLITVWKYINPIGVEARFALISISVLEAAYLLGGLRARED